MNGLYCERVDTRWREVVGSMALVLCSLACSGATDDSCETTGATAVVIEVRDRVTSLPAAFGSYGTISDGNYVDSLHRQGSDRASALYVAAGEDRPGRYDVILYRDGFVPWVANQVEITQKGCDLATDTLVAALNRNNSAMVATFEERSYEFEGHPTLWVYYELRNLAPDTLWVSACDSFPYLWIERQEGDSWIQAFTQSTYCTGSSSPRAFEGGELSVGRAPIVVGGSRLVLPFGFWRSQTRADTAYSAAITGRQ